MLFDYFSHHSWNCISLPVLFLLLCMGYAYRVNARREADDPKRRDYYPGAILLALFTWPLLIFASISLFILRAVVYGIFLVLFSITLVAIRKPFLLIWLNKIFNWIGDKLLTANTFIIKLVFGELKKNTETR